jgi:hypothetical protein
MQHMMAKADLASRAQTRSAAIGTQVRKQAVKAAQGMRHVMSDAVRRAQGKPTHRTRERVQQAAAHAVQLGREHPRAVMATALVATAAVVRRRRTRKR